MSLLLPAHSFHILCGSPLLAWSSRSSSRSSCRCAWRHSSVSPIVPCSVLLAPPVSRHRFSFRLPVSPLACSPRVPIVIALSYCLTPRSSFSPPIAPPTVSNKRGDIALIACLPLPCKAEAFGFSSSLMRGVSACLACGAVLI